MPKLDFYHWYLLVGALLVLMALVGQRVKRLPFTTPMLYLAIGGLLGWVGWLQFDPLRYTALLEHLSEIAVIVSLFTAGLKLRAPFTAGLWRLPVVLAFLSMGATAGMIAGLGVALLELPIGAAILLGAILAPTDPVLASDVQVGDASDTERLRFSLTGEAGLNDGTAFPLVMLGLGLLGLHDLGEWMWWRWWTVDVVWAITGGLACGTVLGVFVGRLVVFLRRRHGEAVGLDDFLALGLIAMAYGLALVLHTYGFLAVFAAGLAIRRVERELSEDRPMSKRPLALPKNSPNTPKRPPLIWPKPCCMQTNSWSGLQN
jgi:sodium/hydrogen antiporter